MGCGGGRLDRHRAIDDELYLRWRAPDARVARCRCPGSHMLRDVLAARCRSAAGRRYAEAIADAIRGFRGVPHRLETVTERDGIRWVNDSQATIPMATMAALDAFAPAPLIVIAGGADKGLDYGAGRSMTAAAKAVILIGETAETSWRGCWATAYRGPGRGDARCGRGGGRVAVRGDVVLLAPAAATFDMYTDYAARGDAFRAAVMRLEGGPERRSGRGHDGTRPPATGVRRDRHEISYPLLVSIIALVAIGVVMVYSASSVRSYISTATRAARGSSRGSGRLGLGRC